MDKPNISVADRFCKAYKDKYYRFTHEDAKALSIKHFKTKKSRVYHFADGSKMVIGNTSNVRIIK